jgi:hypothetical protein
MSYDPNRDGCWQKLLKDKYRLEDLARMGKDEAWAEALTADDFTIRIESTPVDRKRAFAFIEKYEWLGSPPKRGYNHVVCLIEERSTGELGGVTWFCSPNAASTLLPSASEWLLARGATASWTPIGTDPNTGKPRPWLGTWMTTRAIDLLVKKVGGPVLVSGYADSEAGEQGGIYKASNWLQVTARGGTQKMYIDPKRPDYEFSDRKFRCQATYKKFAKKLGVANQIVWRAPKKVGGTSWTPDWEKTPPEVATKLKEAIAAWQATCTMRLVPPKSKWSIARGVNRGETKRLLKELREALAK